MISVIHFIPRGRLSETPSQFDVAPADLEDLIEKQQAMRLTNAANDDDLSEDSESDEEEAEAFERLAKHVENDSENEQMQDDEQAENQEDEQSNEQSDAQPADAADPQADALLDELAMDDYDEEPEGEEMFLGGQSLTVYQSNREDPFLTIPDSEDEDSDEEDATIKPSDFCLMVGRTEEGDQSAMESMIFDQSTGNLFVHHDFQLPSFPLCAAYLDYDPRPIDQSDNQSATQSTAQPNTQSRQGNFLAVGTFLPQIEIWNLDVMDALEPVAILGGLDDNQPEITQSKKSKKSAAPRLKPDSHTEAVLCVAWHPSHRQRLASGSADETVKLWDIETQQCTRTFDHHKRVAPAVAPKSNKKKKKGKSVDDDESWFEEAAMLNASHKVQSIDWHPSEASLLLTGAYDKSVHLLDVRVSANSSSSRVWHVDADAESVRWHPLVEHSFMFIVASESGMVSAFDARKPVDPVFRLSAHSGACTHASFNPVIPTLFMTAGNDKLLKLWDVTMTDDAMRPTLVSEKEMKVGQIWASSWARDSSSVLACGGDKGKVAVWDIREDKSCMARYGAAQQWTALPSSEEETTRAEKRAERSRLRGYGEGSVRTKADKESDDDDDEELEEDA